MDEIKLRWDAYKDGIKFNTETAEKYFTEILKLIVTLSIGLLAFIITIYDKLLRNIPKRDIIILISAFVAAIFFAIISFVLLAVHYKKYADDSHRSLQKLCLRLQSNQVDKVQNEIKEDMNQFLNKKDGGWQNSTMSVGILSFFLFILGISSLMVNFILNFKF